jgi:hypothetical protein
MPRPERWDGWIVHASCPQVDLLRILPELVGSDIMATVSGESLFLTAPSVTHSISKREAEWAAYNLLQLISAAGNLWWNPGPSLSFVAVNAGQSTIRRENDSCTPCDRLTIGEIVTVAEEHQHVREALLLYAAGGIQAFFKAYESISYMILDLGLTDYRSDIGTLEWLLLHGFANQGEEDRLFATRHLFNRNEQLAIEPFSPHEAQQFVSKVILNVVGYCACRRYHKSFLGPNALAGFFRKSPGVKAQTKGGWKA